MNERNLPIQLVETRGERDLFFKEGMGDNSLPSWSTPESLAEHVSIMTGTFSNIENIFDSREEEGLPILMIATLDERASKRKAYRANARSIFDGRNKRNILGKDSHQGLLVKVDNKRDLQSMRENINGNISQDKLCGVAVIDNLELFHPSIEPDLEGQQIKVKLVDYKNQHFNNLAHQKLLQIGEQYNACIEALDYSPGLNLYSIENATSEVIDALATMDAVISVKRMPYFELTISPELFNTELEVRTPIPGESYPVVGLLDSGVERIPHLASWIEAEDNTADLEDGDIRRLHGTSVAGILCYGDELEGEVLTGTSPVKIRSFIVNTDDRVMHISEKEMVEHIKTAISRNPDVHVWNLSQGSKEVVENDEFSDFAMALDRIQKDNHILICKSAGNCGFSDRTGITQGAESVMSLTVGSIAHICTTEGDSPVGGRSYFSRIGPGPGGLIKPDLVHAGGNLHSGVYSFSDTGYQASAYKGTSFSTPRVSALAASLEHRLNRPFDQLFTKALLIHSSFYPLLTEGDNTVLFKELGFGRPAIIDDILFNNPDEFTMVWKPELREGVDMQIQDIPFPSCLVENGHYTGEIMVTLVTNPVLRDTEKSEYCQSDVKVLLQTYDRIEYVVLGAAGTPSRYKNSERLVNPKNVLTKSLYNAPSFSSTEFEARTLICGEDYLPIKRYHINLQQMKPSPHNECLGGNRKWCLKIETTYRDATMKDKESGLEVDSVEAVVIVSIKDPRHQGVLYDECMLALENHNFAHSDIAVRQIINVENE